VNRLSERYAYIVLEAEKWWDRRCRQSKTGKALQAFVRHGKVGPLDAKLLLFYVKHPIREIRGKADFLERVVGDADELWNKYGAETVFESYDEYKEFLAGRQEATFVRFKNFQELMPPISRESFLGKTGGGATLPRNGKYLSKELANMLV
jgi:predicted transcriptional regulator